VREAEPGAEPGFYRLAIADGKWDRMHGFDGVTVNQNGWEGFPSLTADGQVAMMNDTSIVQIYSTTWAKGADSH